MAEQRFSKTNAAKPRGRIFDDLKANLPIPVS